jgi:hypothetical protein
MPNAQVCLRTVPIPNAELLGAQFGAKLFGTRAAMPQMLIDGSGTPLINWEECKLH